MGGHQLRPSAGPTTAIVHRVQCDRVQCAGQLQREAVVGGEPVGGELGLSADRGVGQWTEHRRQPDEGQHSPDHPLALEQGTRHGHDDSGDHDDDPSAPGLAAGQDARQTGQQARRQAPRRGKDRHEQHRPSCSRGVMAQFVHQQGHQLVLRQSTGSVVLQDPAGDRDAAPAGGVRVGHPSVLDVQLDATGGGAGHS
jgi:hypothetical protein